MKDLLTLQFGPYASAVGSEYWGAQNELLNPEYFTSEGDCEVDHRVLFHEAATALHPRLVLFDAKDSPTFFQTGGSTSKPQEGPVSGTRSAGSAAPYAALRPGSSVAVGGRTPTGELLGSASSAGFSSSSQFSAFSQGRGLMSEELLEPVRRWLEESDGLQGVQVAVDPDSGWGGFSAAYLAALREDLLPRTPLLVLSTIQPASVAQQQLLRAAGPSQVAAGTAEGAGKFEYAVRDRAMLRAVNLGLAYAAFGGPSNDLDATHVPLATSGLPAFGGSIDGEGLLRGFDPDSPAHAAALCAAAWDTATLPIRRNAWPPSSSGSGSGIMSLGGRGAGGSRFDPVLTWSYTAGTLASSAATGGGYPSSSSSSSLAPRSAQREGSSGGGGGGGSGVGVGSGAMPLAALSHNLRLGDLLAALSVRPALRVSSVTMAFPFPYPRASARELVPILAALPPIHRCGSAAAVGLSPSLLLLPLSWPEPPALLRRPPGQQSRAHTYGGGAPTHELNERARQDRVEEDLAARPFAVSLVMRGVGSHALMREEDALAAAGRQSASSARDQGPRGASRALLPKQQPSADGEHLDGGGAQSQGGGSLPRYGSSLAEYGLALDAYLERSGCRQAGHAVMRTPLPLRSGFPSVFEPPLQGAAGRARRLDAVGGWGAGAEAEEGGEEEGEEGAAAASSSLPYSLPVCLPVCLPVLAALPYSLPVLAALQTGPEYGPVLRAVHEGFRARDSSVLHRFLVSGLGGGDGSNGPRGGYEAQELVEVECALAGLVDEYDVASQAEA